MQFFCCAFPIPFYFDPFLFNGDFVLRHLFSPEMFVKLWIIRSFQYRHLRHHRMLDHPYFSHSFCFDPFLFIFHHVCLCVIDFHFSSLHFLFSLLPFLFIFSSTDLHIIIIIHLFIHRHSFALVFICFLPFQTT
eukprot:376778_1